MTPLLISDFVPPAAALGWLMRAGACEWADARATAGRWARPAKRASMAIGGAADKLRTELVEVLVGDDRVATKVLPLRVTDPAIVRYSVGDAYVLHEDNAVHATVRADVSFTIWLSSPDDYEGGALVLERSGTARYRPPAGSILLYESGTPHEVTEVLSGTRVVAVGWIQSLVRDGRDRDLVTSMSEALDRLLERSGTIDPELAVLNRVRTELLRRWAET